jgi:MFS transporter, AAHS family, 4-hydroxybenzoate transporter
METRSIEFNELLDSSPFGRLQRSVVLLCALVAMLDGFDTQAIAYVAPIIAVQWHLNVAAFGPIFGAGLFGLTIGALAFGPAADKWGRKTMLVISVVIFGVFSLATSLASTFGSLLVLRFLTGVGLGGAMPNLVALTSEFSPKRLRATVVTIMFCGVPLGATLGGIVSAWMLPQFGWISVFYLGGIAPLLLAVLLMIRLPESIRFMLVANESSVKARSIASHISAVKLDPSHALFLAEDNSIGSGVLQLFAKGQLGKTLLLWVAFFMNLLVMYFLINWLPTLARQAGLSIGAAIVATVALNLGGVFGALAVGRIIDRAGPFAVLAATHALSAIAIAMMAGFGTNVDALLVFVFLAGGGVIGAQIGMNALTAEIYPTAVRSTGVGWALGVGRVGSIIGPVLGGLLLAREIPTEGILYLAALPSLLASVAVLALGRLREPSVDAPAVSIA